MNTEIGAFWRGGGDGECDCSDFCMSRLRKLCFFTSACPRLGDRTCRT